MKGEDARVFRQDQNTSLAESAMENSANSLKSFDSPKYHKLNQSDRKIPFMTHLDQFEHGRFERLHLDVRSEARSRTGKTLSQSEMVEVLIKFTIDKTGKEISELVKLAENIIENR